MKAPFRKCQHQTDVADGLPEPFSTLNTEINPFHPGPNLVNSSYIYPDKCPDIIATAGAP